MKEDVVVEEVDKPVEENLDLDFLTSVDST